MISEFYELSNFSQIEELRDSSEFKLARAQSLAIAIREHRDFSLIELFREINPQRESEVIIVDVECNCIPQKPAIDIQYRERLAIRIYADQKSSIEVLALRKNFPRLIHQNQVHHNTPASLCLYAESALEISRTWTPKNFLSRIQHWLVKTSKASLHDNEQPVEHLFFSSKYEIILPHDFNILSDDKSKKFCLFRRDEYEDVFTFFVCLVEKNPDKIPCDTAFIELYCEPIVHGKIEYAETIGDLSDIFCSHGVDLIVKLREKISALTGEKGVLINDDSKSTIILLHVPICREVHRSPEREDLYAFFIPIGQFKLGELLGEFFLMGSKYTRFAALEINDNNEWRNQVIAPMSVLYCNSAKAARDQSGLSNAGYKSVLVGVGSLGSALLNIWVRSGWGQWTVIDNDHIKPHNISRHMAFAQHIGLKKTEVMTELSTATTKGATEVIGLFADACDISEEKAWSAIEEAELVIDVSTTLEYPRLSSCKNNIGRHFSVFVTHDGNSAILLAEDKNRFIKLRTLEAQYYRALINEAWGDLHCSENTKTFLSGSSCRDISLVLPYSRILSHAGNLAEQIQLASTNPDALVRVWIRDPEKGEVTVYSVPVTSDRAIKFGKLDLFIDSNLEEKLKKIRVNNFPNETGGILIGYYDFNINSVVIVDALTAPEDSISSPNAFERGTNKLEAVVACIKRKTADVVGYIGEWHSHPPGRSGRPSQQDLYQFKYLAHKMAEDGLPIISLIVGEDGICILDESVEGVKWQNKKN